ncbi:MAG: HU family DNA-binding protein [Lachnospiraceae bacterium]|nr:HU family DNA-binding protein [Lachnospiraceae bacterium]
MNKGELVEAIVKETGVEKKDVDSVLKSFTKTITEQLVKRDRIQLIGFGTFETRERAARSGRNPQTGEVIQIAASIAPVFKAGKALKAAVAKPPEKEKKKKTTAKKTTKKK